MISAEKEAHRRRVLEHLTCIAASGQRFAAPTCTDPQFATHLVGEVRQNEREVPYFRSWRNCPSSGVLLCDRGQRRVDFDADYALKTGLGRQDEHTPLATAQVQEGVRSAGLTMNVGGRPQPRLRGRMAPFLKMPLLETGQPGCLFPSLAGAASIEISLRLR